MNRLHDFWRLYRIYRQTLPPLQALVAGGISEADAKTVITLIAKKAVPAVTISY